MQKEKHGIISSIRQFFSFLDAVASVGFHMSVGLSVTLFDDGTSVSNGIVAYSCNNLCVIMEHIVMNHVMNPVMNPVMNSVMNPVMNSVMNPVKIPVINPVMNTVMNIVMNTVMNTEYCFCN